MDQVVAESHLVLLLGFIEVTVQHLKNSVFGVNLSVVVLLEDLNVFFELLGLCQSEHLAPMGKDLHPVEVSHLLLLNHLRLQIFTAHPHKLRLLVKILHALVLVPDADLDVPFVVVVGGATLNVLSELNHLSVTTYFKLIINSNSAFQSVHPLGSSDFSSCVSNYFLGPV